MVLLKNVVQLVCSHQSVTKEIMVVAQECNDIADQTTLLCSTVQDRDIQGMIDTTQTISTEMRSMSGDDGTQEEGGQRKRLLDGKLIQQIKELIEQSKTKQVLQFLDDIQTDSRTIGERAITMQQAIQRGIDSLPDGMKEKYDKDQTMINDTMLDTAIQNTNKNPEQGLQRGMMTTTPNDPMIDRMGQEERDMIQLLNIDSDVNELETTCQRGLLNDNDTVADGTGGRKRLMDFNILKKILNGSLLYEQAQQKGLKCQSILQQMRTLCSTIVNLMSSFLQGGCCVQTMAVMSNIGNLFRCRNIIILFQKAIQTIQRMIQTMQRVIQTTVQQIQQQFQDLNAAKKIGTFVTNAVQHTKVGQFLANTITKDSKVGNVCNGIISNILK